MIFPHTALTLGTTASVSLEPSESKLGWMLDVQCSMLDVSALTLRKFAGAPR